MTSDAAQKYVGHHQKHTGSISQQRFEEINSTFGWAVDASAGQPLAQLSHWCAFSPMVPTEDLGTDGHPHKGGFLPDLGLERRMWASGSLEFLQPLHVNEILTRSATIEKIDEKGGRMAFVTVSHEIHGENGLAIRESQNIVYLAMPKKFDPPVKRPMPEKWVFQNRLAMPSTRLFRFSSITFNAHRIHYDLPYAKDIEKYPGLVVHGPLQAMFLAKAAGEYAKAELRSFQFRGIHPAFHFDDLVVCAEEQTFNNTLSLYAGVPGGHQTMQAKATW